MDLEQSRSAERELVHPAENEPLVARRGEAPRVGGQRTAGDRRAALTDRPSLSGSPVFRHHVTPSRKAILLRQERDARGPQEGDVCRSLESGKRLIVVADAEVGGCRDPLRSTRSAERLDDRLDTKAPERLDAQLLTERHDLVSECEDIGPRHGSRLRQPLTPRATFGGGMRRQGKRKRGEGSVANPDVHRAASAAREHMDGTRNDPSAVFGSSSSTKSGPVTCLRIREPMVAPSFT